MGLVPSMLGRLQGQTFSPSDKNGCSRQWSWPPGLVHVLAGTSCLLHPNLYILQRHMAFELFKNKITI